MSFTVTKHRVYLNRMKVGSIFNGMAIRKCPACGKPGTLLVGGTPVKIWAHQFHFRRGQKEPAVFGCESRIDVPGIVLPREVIAAQRRG